MKGSFYTNDYKESFQLCTEGKQRVIKAKAKAGKFTNSQSLNFREHVLLGNDDIFHHNHA